MIFEVCFENEEQWGAFRNLPAVRAALDGVPDPVNGLLIYRGRGGGAGPRNPRKPKPAPSASAMSLPEPDAEPYLNLSSSTPPDLVTSRHRQLSGVAAGAACPAGAFARRACPARAC